MRAVRWSTSGSEPAATARSGPAPPPAGRAGQLPVGHWHWHCGRRVRCRCARLSGPCKLRKPELVRGPRDLGLVRSTHVTVTAAPSAGRACSWPAHEGPAAARAARMRPRAIMWLTNTPEQDSCILRCPFPRIQVAGMVASFGLLGHPWHWHRKLGTGARSPKIEEDRRKPSRVHGNLKGVTSAPLR